MATRSRIAIEKHDGTVNSIYCHFDGYVSNNGVLLHENYNDALVLEKLIKLGDISELGNTSKTTVAYHRDRGDTKTSKQFKNVATLFAKSEESYIYCLTKASTWMMKEADGKVCELRQSIMAI